MYQNLFTPIQLRGLELRNRVMLPSMGTKFCGRDGRDVTESLIAYHAARAAGGCGLNMLEVTSVHEKSAPFGFLSIANDACIPGFKKLTSAIHSAGGKAGVMLWQGSLAISQYKGAKVYVPSDVALGPGMEYKAMSLEEIQEIVGSYGVAAARAVEAGFDCMEIHLGHNYLPHSFLSPGMNRRTDAYGGSLENRARLPLEIIREVRRNIPQDMPLMIRVVAMDDNFKDGLTIEDTIRYATWAKAAGVDAIDVSRGNFMTNALRFEVPSIDIPRGFNVENAARIRACTGLVTVGVGRINDPGLADRLIAEGKVDMVAAGRAQIADPEYCNKAMAGRTDSICRCIACNIGCNDNFSNPAEAHISCTCNPMTGRESEQAPSRTDNARTVLVAGGGLAGLEAALTLHSRGHKPVLCEAGDALGGQFLLSCANPIKGEMLDKAHVLFKKVEDAGIEVRLNTPVTGELIEQLRPAAVINATGAEVCVPDVPGRALGRVHDYRDVLTGKTKLSGHIVVVGGDMVGLDVAEYLDYHGCQVTVLQASKRLARDLGEVRMFSTMDRIRHGNIKTITEFRLTELTRDAVKGCGKDGVESVIACDGVIFAAERRPACTEQLEEACKAQGIPCYTVGDAKSPRNVFCATREAYEAAVSFDQ